MKKEELEKEVRLLKERVEANKKMSDGYVDDLAKAEQELKDFNKPVLTSTQLADIEAAIERAVGDFNFDEPDTFEYDFSLNYENKIEIESLNFMGHYELNERIAREIFALFKEVENDNS